ncbi:InlB B-repeat-containing protein [Adlercreutzia sp. ZJ473]|uniref:InlB B-repeat-containing protein n=1 Tax=Adlercreutzia sp. ZJ473 TaxID=2722822 RepID=UPI001556B05C|nr:InlB B-repeat-containing protein [Adlercreutzia sp. ZJ473]
MFERLVDAKGTFEGKVLSVLLSVALVLSVTNVFAFAEAGGVVSKDAKTEQADPTTSADKSKGTAASESATSGDTKESAGEKKAAPSASSTAAVAHDPHAVLPTPPLVEANLDEAVVTFDLENAYVEVKGQKLAGTKKIQMKIEKSKDLTFRANANAGYKIASIKAKNSATENVPISTQGDVSAIAADHVNSTLVVVVKVEADEAAEAAPASDTTPITNETDIKAEGKAGEPEAGTEGEAGAEAGKEAATGGEPEAVTASEGESEIPEASEASEASEPSDAVKAPEVETPEASESEGSESPENESVEPAENPAEPQGASAGAGENDATDADGQADADGKDANGKEDAVDGEDADDVEAAADEVADDAEPADKASADEATDDNDKAASDGKPADDEAAGKDEAAADDEVVDKVEAADNGKAAADDDKAAADDEVVTVHADVSSPAFEGYAYVGDVIVKVTAGEGILPEGTAVEAVAVERQDVIDAVSDKVEAQGKELQDAVAIDVTLLDKDGNTIQPDGAVNVCFFNASVEGEEVGVYRVSDDAAKVETIGTRQATSDVQSFDVDHFTDYVIAGLSLFSAEASQSVKQGTIRFDPNSEMGATGTAFTREFSDGKYTLPGIASTDFVNEGHTFVGWSTNKAGNGSNYTPQQIAVEDGQTYYAIWLSNNPSPNQAVRAEYFIRIDGEMPYEPDAASHSKYFPSGGCGHGILWSSGTGRVKSDIAINNNLAAVEANIGVGPTNDDITAAVNDWNAKNPGNQVTFDPAKQKVTWYVIKKLDDYYLGPHYNVDGIIQNLSSHTVTYDPNGGDSRVPERSTYTEGSTVNVNFNMIPSRSGYTFLGWSDSATASEPQYKSGETTSFMMPNADVTLYAIWKAQNVVLTYDGNGGATEQGNNAYTETHEVATTFELKANEFKRAGYSFEGWAISPQGGVKYTDKASYTMHAANTTLYAVWKPNGDTPYKVEYYYMNDNGTYSTVADSSVERSDTTDTKATVTDTDRVPLRDDYIFDTNAKNVLSGNIAGDGSLVLKVYFKKQFTVTYLPGDLAKPGSKQQVTSGLDYGAQTPAAPAYKGQPGYTFTGWSPEVAGTVTGSVTYTAQWTQDVYAVTYTDGVEGEEVFADQKHESLTYGTATPAFDGAGDATAPARAGYTFTGWSPEVAGTVTGSVTYTAQWTQDVYAVTYTDGVEGEEVFADQKHESLTYGTATPAFDGAGDATAPARAGYTFTGWSPEVAGTVTGSVTYTAQWMTNPNARYEVQHYRQDVVGDGYSLFEMLEGTGSAGAEVTAAPKNYKGFTHVMTGDSVESGVIAGDGSLVLRLYYDRDLYAVNGVIDNDGSVEGNNQEARYQASSESMTFTAASGYRIVSIAVNGEPQSVAPGTTSYTFGPIPSVDRDYMVNVKTAALGSIVAIAPSGQKTYDGAPLIPGAAVFEGLPAGYTAEAVISGEQTNAGSSASTLSNVVVRDADGNDVTGNFAIEVKDGTLVVDPAPAIITVDSSSKQVGTADPAFAGSVAGLMSQGDLGVVTYYRIGDEEAVGSYPDVLVASYASNPNYTVEIVPGTFTITEEPVSEEPAPDTPGGTTPEGPTPGSPGGTTPGGAAPGGTTPAPGGTTPGSIIPVIPAPPTPAQIPGTVPDGAAAPVITPLVDALEGAAEIVIGEDATPLADIGDEATPLAERHVSCWVHLYIILGIIVTLVYAACVAARRALFSHRLKKYEDDIAGDDGSPSREPAHEGFGLGPVPMAPRGATATAFASQSE